MCIQSELRESGLIYERRVIMLRKMLLSVVLAIVFCAVVNAERNYTYVLTVGMDANDPNYDPNTNYTTINAAIRAMNAENPPLASDRLGCIKIYPGTYVEHLNDHYSPDGNNVPAHCDLIGMGDDIYDIVIQHGGKEGNSGDLYEPGVNCLGDNIVFNLKILNLYISSSAPGGPSYVQNGIRFNGDGELKNCIVHSLHGPAIQGYGHLVISGCPEVYAMWMQCIRVYSTFEISDSTINPHSYPYNGEIPTGIYIKGPGGTIDNVTITDYSTASKCTLKGIELNYGIPGPVVRISNTTINLKLKTRPHPSEQYYSPSTVQGIFVRKGYALVEDCNITISGIEDTNNTSDPCDDGKAIKVSGIQVTEGATVEVCGNSKISTSRTTASDAANGYEYLLMNTLDGYRLLPGNGTLAVDFNTVTFDPNGSSEPNEYDPNYVYGTVIQLVRARNITQDANYVWIQDAIDDANNGDVIEVCKGPHFENIRFNCKAITVRGSDPNNWETVAATIIDGGNNGNVVGFYCNTCSTTTVLEGLTVRNSGATSCGILVFEDAAPLITKCIIEDNYNGVGCGNGWPLITNNIIRNNSGSGLAIGGDAGPTIRNNLIYSNVRGMECEYYSQVSNNTVVNNQDKGIISYWGSEEETLNVKNCIVWGNGDDLSGCTATYSCIRDGDEGYGNIQDDPLFVPNDNFYHLTSTSPCIDAGDPSGNYTGQTDIDNQDRAAGIVEMGADELARVYNQTQDKWYSSIQAAIDDSSTGDEIIVYPGIYYENIWNDRTITIRSSAPNNWETVAATIIDGNNSDYYVVEIYSDGAHVWPEEEGALLEGFTIRGGDSSGNYAAAMCYNATIRKCIVENNGNGIDCGYYGIVGGNIIRNNSFAGIRSWGAFYIIKNNMIFNNPYGIRPWLYGTSTAQVINNTIVNNESAGIYCYGGGGAPIITDCIVWDNNDNLYNCSATYSCIEDCNDIGNPYVTHNFCSAPLFVDADANDFHLLSTSPCINAGDPSSGSYYAGAKDIDNETRVWIIDVGADEYYSY